MKHLILFRLIIILLFCFVFSFKLIAQDKPKKTELNGYLNNMQSIQFQDLNGTWINDNILQNRLNFTWFLSDKFTFATGLRTRFFTGESIKLIPGYADMIESSDLGWMNLNFNIFADTSYALNMNIDRLYLQYQIGKFKATIGRQRINWSNTFVWNPNDLFNTYSFFDFDYVERPGSDAIRLQYFTSEVSSVELAAKIDKNEDYTASMLWKFNRLNYDFQLLGGVLNSSELAIGGGWSGALKNIDFKGETTYLRPLQNMNDTTGQFMASVMLGYTFKNSVDVKLEFLYTDLVNGSFSNFYQFYYLPLSVKTLSFTEFNLFGQTSYQITPLLFGSFSCMWYPKLNGFFAGPSIDYSFADNLFVSFVIQYFNAEMNDPQAATSARQDATFAYLRLKWNF
ncbi:MAG: hypothetical protein U0W24_21770 [Bacteroidales bacterium]